MQQRRTKIRIVNEVVRDAVDVPRNADRINKTENQHDPERDAREKVKHAEEVDAVQNACRDRDDIPACVRKDPGICLWTLDRDQFTRRSWHCVQGRLLEYTIFTDKSSRKFSFRLTAGRTSHCGKGQPNGGEKFLVVEWLGEKS